MRDPLEILKRIVTGDLDPFLKEMNQKGLFSYLLNPSDILESFGDPESQKPLNRFPLDGKPVIADGRMYLIDRSNKQVVINSFSDLNVDNARFEYSAPYFESRELYYDTILSYERERVVHELALLDYESEIKEVVKKVLGDLKYLLVSARSKQRVFELSNDYYREVFDSPEETIKESVEIFKKIENLLTELFFMIQGIYSEYISTIIDSPQNLYNLLFILPEDDRSVLRYLRIKASFVLDSKEENGVSKEDLLRVYGYFEDDHRKLLLNNGGTLNSEVRDSFFGLLREVENKFFTANPPFNQMHLDEEGDDELRDQVILWMKDYEQVAGGYNDYQLQIDLYQDGLRKIEVAEFFDDSSFMVLSIPRILREEINSRVLQIQESETVFYQAKQAKGKIRFLASLRHLVYLYLCFQDEHVGLIDAKHSDNDLYRHLIAGFITDGTSSKIGVVGIKKAKGKIVEGSKVYIDTYKACTRLLKKIQEDAEKENLKIDWKSVS